MVLVCVSEHSIGNWMNSEGELVDPEDATRFSLTDSICIPGLWPKGIIPPVQSPAEDELYIGLGKTTLRLQPSGKLLMEGDVEITGKLLVKGDIEGEKEVSAKMATPASKVSLSTHIHPTPAGPSSQAQPGS